MQFAEREEPKGKHNDPQEKNLDSRGMGNTQTLADVVANAKSSRKRQQKDDCPDYPTFFEPQLPPH
jgi:hypothetical protein